MLTDLKPTTADRPPDFRVVVSWIEIGRRDGKEMRLNYSTTYIQQTLEESIAFRARALMNNGWLESTAHEIEIELMGKDAPRAEPSSSEQRRAGLAAIRRAIADASGPLLTGNPVGLAVDNKSRAAGERVAS